MIVKFNAVLLALVLLTHTGCGTPQSGSSTSDRSDTRFSSHSLVHNGEERTYHVRLPADFSTDKRHPLALVLHGGSGRGEDFDRVMTSGTLHAAAEARNVVLVFPDGINRQWNDGRTEIFRGDEPHDDVGFISALIDTLIEEYNVDASRMYATGISNGGFMSVRLAMELSDKLAAVAPVTAQVSQAIADRRPVLPISVMFVNGTADPLVPFEGGHVRLFRLGRSRGEVLATEQSTRLFREHNNCATPAVEERIRDHDPDDGTTVQVQTHGDCDAGTEVVLIQVNGGGHTWPGGNQYMRPKRVGLVSRDIDASEIILDFLLSHSRR